MYRHDLCVVSPIKHLDQIPKAQMDSGETSDPTTINNLLVLDARGTFRAYFFPSVSRIHAVVCGPAVPVINRDHLPAPASQL